jgi:hypothetical protein
LCVFISLLSALSGCDDGYYEVPIRSRPIDPKPVPELELKSEIRAGANPDQYAVALTWRGNYQPGSWIVRRAEEKSQGKVLEALLPGSGRFDDKAPEPGKLYRYEIGTAGPDGFYPIGEVKVPIPKDLAIRGRMPLPERTNYQRLFFFENSILETNGAPVRLEVGEIIAAWGTIEIFAEGRKAQGGISGKTPGSIAIHALRGTGRLRVVARGEAGGDGIDGRRGIKGTTGASGAPGDWGMNPELYKHLFANFIESFERSMRQRPKPPGDPEWNYTLGNMRRFVCARPPTNGARGANGQDALDGGDGQNGGDSGRVLIQVDEGDLLVSVHSEPGKSGLGGRPGKGGEGGDGGAPGALDQGHLCPPARSGERGRPGLDGRQGRAGENGKASPVCVKVGRQTSGDCEKFN